MANQHEEKPEVLIMARINNAKQLKNIFGPLKDLVTDATFSCEEITRV